MGKLVLTRKNQESIVIGDSVKVTVVGIQNGQVRLLIDAPKHINVDREEVNARKQADARNS